MSQDPCKSWHLSKSNQWKFCSPPEKHNTVENLWVQRWQSLPPLSPFPFSPGRTTSSSRCSLISELDQKPQVWDFWWRKGLFCSLPIHMMILFGTFPPVPSFFTLCGAPNLQSLPFLNPYSSSWHSCWSSQTKTDTDQIEIYHFTPEFFWIVALDSLCKQQMLCQILFSKDSFFLCL